MTVPWKKRRPLNLRKKVAFFLLPLPLLAATEMRPDCRVDGVCDVAFPKVPGATVETRRLDGGFAWRLRFSDAAARIVTNEVWRFDFGADLRCWPVARAQSAYAPKRLSSIGGDRRMKPSRHGAYANWYPGSAEGPLVVEGPGWVAALGDAGVIDYARLRFTGGGRTGCVATRLEGAAHVPSTRFTPWRYIHVAKDCVALANAQRRFLDALNEPSRLADTSWIRPGKVMRVARLTTQDGFATVDFAARNGLQYVEVDAGWYGPEQTGDPLKPSVDPRRAVKGAAFDLQAIIDRARSKGLGVILYVNWRPLLKARDAILDRLVAMGASGVKYGFVDVGSQMNRIQVVAAIEAAAKRRLVVDIHDEFRLTGIQRTFPHVLTVEGICGNEEMPSAAHNAALPFTRYLDGPGDYTFCWGERRVKNTLAHQLALPLLYDSGLQFLYWYQTPAMVDERNPALAFWRELPVAFDETRWLQGRIGECAVVARRRGDTWFLAGINAGKMRTFRVPLDFAGKGRLTVRLFRDAEAANTRFDAPVRTETQERTASESLEVTAAANGGFAAIIE